MTGPVRGIEDAKVQQRTNNGHLKDVEQRAIDAIMKRRKDQAAAAKSVSIQTVVWANELTLEIGAQMVGDVRSDVIAHIRGCSLCYLIAGDAATTHKAGSRCPKMPLAAETTGWVPFKEELKFIDGIYCWNCLLPTVRVSSSKF